MTNKTALFAQSIQCSPSTIMVMMLSMNTSIDASVALMSNDKGYAIARWLADCCFSYCESKYWCGEFRSSVSQDSSRSISFPRYISASLTVVYSDGADVVSKGNLRHRKASSSTIAIHLNTVVVFLCI